MGSEADPHSQIRTTVQDCQLHKLHKPESHINHRHHIWPLGEGGPDIEDNIIVACPTGHMNCHQLIREFQLHMGNVPYTILRTYSHGERAIAELGYKRIMRQGM